MSWQALLELKRWIPGAFALAHLQKAIFSQNGQYVKEACATPLLILSTHGLSCLLTTIQSNLGTSQHTRFSDTAD